jgi:hypothetical protein
VDLCAIDVVAKITLMKQMHAKRKIVSPKENRSHSAFIILTRCTNTALHAGLLVVRILLIGEFGKKTLLPSVAIVSIKTLISKDF